MTVCPSCRDTGYRPDDSPCRCDARPFDPPSLPRGGCERAPTSPVFTRAEAVRADVDRIYHGAEITVVIDHLLHLCRELLAGPIGLGELVPYITNGGPLHHVAPRILHHLESVDAAVVELPQVAGRLRTIAQEAAA